MSIVDRLRNLRDVLPPRDRERVEKDEAIALWENDPETNDKGFQVVRGTDGRPVEIIMKTKRLAAFVVNGEEREFILADLHHYSTYEDPIPSLCLSGKLRQIYAIKMVKALNYGRNRKPLTVLAGIPIPIGEPPGLPAWT